MKFTDSIGWLTNPTTAKWLRAIWWAYRAARIDSGGAECDFHGLQRRLQEDGELVGTGRAGEIRVHRLEADDLIEATLQPQPLQSPDRVGSVGVREDLRSATMAIDRDMSFTIRLGFRNFQGNFASTARDLRFSSAEWSARGSWAEGRAWSSGTAIFRVRNCSFKEEIVNGWSRKLNKLMGAKQVTYTHLYLYLW